MFRKSILLLPFVLLLSTTQGQICYKPLEQFLSGTFVGLADFNKDSTIDIFTLNVNKKQYNWYLGKPDLTYTGSPTTFLYTPKISLVDDFNNDSKPDFLITDNSSGLINVNINGEINHATAYNGFATTAIQVAELTGDNKPDLILFQPNTNQGTMLVYPGNGDGTFKTPITKVIGSAVEKAVFGDFNKDLKTDIVTDVGLFMAGNGTGVFADPVASFQSEGFISAIETADLNKDLKLDIIVAVDDTVSIYTGNGNGTFNAYKKYSVGKFKVDGVFFHNEIAVGDLNADTKLDLLVTSVLENKIIHMYGNGSGEFTIGPAYIISGSPSKPYIGDFNKDGKTDFAAANGSSVVFMLNGNASVAAPVISPDGDALFYCVGALPATLSATGENLRWAFNLNFNWNLWDFKNSSAPVINSDKVSGTVNHVDQTLNGCQGPVATKYVSIVSCTGIHKFKDETFNMYPNPVIDKLSVLFSENYTDGVAEIIDMHGTVIKKFIVNGLDMQIDTENLGSGMYLLKISADKKLTSKVFFK